MLSDFKERRHNSDDEKSHYELWEVKRAIPNQHILLSVLIVIIAVILFSTAYASGDDPFEGMQNYYERQYKVDRDFIADESTLISLNIWTINFQL